jgi:hypothetical protein
MASIIKRVSQKWDNTDHVPYDGTDTSSGEAGGRGSQASPVWSQSANAYGYVSEQTIVENNRRKNYEIYETMDDEYAPASAVLDAYADNCTQLDMHSDSSSQNESHVLTFITDDEKRKDQLGALREKLKLDERAWGLARDLTKKGDVFEEIVVTQDLEIDRLKQLPTELIVRNQDEYGLLKPRAFYQLSKDRGEVDAAFDSWEVIHYRLLRRNEDAYGTSILKSVRKVYKQLRMIEDAMVIARLTRANSRLVYMVDTGGMTPDQSAEHVEKMKKSLRRKRYVDNYGAMRMNTNPMSAEEDIFLGVGPNSQSRVDQLYGDLNIGNLTDVEYFQNQFFGGVKVPKSYVGLERDLNSKQTLSMQDIQFARSIRRIQLAMRVGYQQLMNLHLILSGEDESIVTTPDFKIALPSLQTVDELRSWEVKRIQAEVARYYVQELYLDPVTVYTHLLGFSLDQAKQLFKGTDKEFVQAQRNKNAVKSFNNTADKKLGTAVGETVGFDTLQGLRDLCEMVLEATATEEARSKGSLV